MTQTPQLPFAGHEVLAFRTSLVAPRARAWLREGEKVSIGSRAFDLLISMLNARGEVLSKAALLDQVWPATVVSEEKLRVQMTALRRAMGTDADLIKTVAGRGYMFAEEAPAKLTSS